MSVLNVSQSSILNAGACTPSTVNVTTTSSSALAANTSRKRCLLLNPASNTNNIIISFGATATAATGISLPPGFGWVEDAAPIYIGAFSCITTSGTANLSVFEWA